MADSEERRAPVQSVGPPIGTWMARDALARGELVKPPGTVGWAEHEEAWRAYAKRYGTYQSAERIAERGGFCYGELTEFLGREPATWRPR